MKQTLLTIAVLVVLGAFGYRTCRGSDTSTNHPPVLLSSQVARAAMTNAPPPERVPLYVLPEVIAVMTPTGQLLFAPQLHVEELARRFPSARVTNVVIWSRP